MDGSKTKMSRHILNEKRTIKSSFNDRKYNNVTKNSGEDIFDLKSDSAKTTRSTRMYFHVDDNGVGDLIVPSF